MPPSAAELRAERRAVAAGQLLLIRAAVLEPEPALAAWDRWSRQADPERMHHGEARLLAGGFRRLERIGAEGPMMTVARGIYRRTWYANQLAVRRIAAVLERLEAAAVPALVLKGFALAPLAYGDLGARPMEDVDLLVPPRQIERAVACLETLGLRNELGRRRPDGLLANEVELIDADGNSVELHAYALVESADDSDLWERRVRFEVREAAAYAPCAEDALLIVGVHGQRWNRVQPVAWVLDACRLVSSRGANGVEFDWDRFCERAIARELTVPARRIVSMLESVEVAVPAAVGARLSASPVGLGRAIGDRAGRAVPGRLSNAALAWDRYRRFRDGALDGDRPAGPLDWAATVWNLDRAAELPAEGVRRLRSLNHYARERSA